MHEAFGCFQAAEAVRAKTATARSATDLMGKDWNTTVAKKWRELQWFEHKYWQHCADVKNGVSSDQLDGEAEDPEPADEAPEEDASKGGFRTVPEQLVGIHMYI